MLIDEEVSQLVSDKFNLMIDENFIKIYYNVLRGDLRFSNNMLMFLQPSVFEMKLSFITNICFTAGYMEFENFKRSPWMCKKNIINLYE